MLKGRIHERNVSQQGTSAPCATSATRLALSSPCCSAPRAAASCIPNVKVSPVSQVEWIHVYKMHERLLLISLWSKSRENKCLRMDWFDCHLYKSVFDVFVYLICLTLVVTFPEELFGLFSSQVERVAFTCTACSAARSPGGAAHSGWREQLQGALRARMEQVLTELLSSSTTQHLNRCRTVGDTSDYFTVLTLGDTTHFTVRTVGDPAPSTVRTVGDPAPSTVRTVGSLLDIPLCMQDVQQYLSQ